MECARKCFKLDIWESALCGDAVSGWTRSLRGTGSAGMGCYPCYFPRRELPEPIALFPMVRASMLFRRVLAYVVEVRRGLNRGRTEAHCSSNNRRDKTTSNYNIPTNTVRLIPGDTCWTEVNPFRGEREIESRWDEEDYGIMRQVANGPSSYELKRLSGRMKAPHQDGFSRVATPQGESTALCQNEYANADLTTHSALTESTPLECDIDLPRNNMGERQS